MRAGPQLNPAPREGDATAAALAARLLGRWPEAAIPVTGGANSRVFQVVCDGSLYALKIYPANDRRNRLETEWAALGLCRRHGIETVPRPLAHDPDGPCALYEWICGERPAADPANIGAMLELTRALWSVAATAEGGSFPAASTSCFTVAEALAQIGERRQALDEDRRLPAEARDFLATAVEPASARLLARLRRVAPAAPALAITLSPSDFGLHNMLRRPDGRVCFLDFEYFGRDDAAKMTADVLLHPGSALPPEAGARFRREAIGIFGGADQDFENRLNCYSKALALVWSMIVLNPFLRPPSGTGGLSAGMAREQLDKARRFVAMAEEEA